MTTPSDRPAREDYPYDSLQGTGTRPGGRYDRAMNEIDTLRKEVRYFQKIAGLAILDRCRPVLEALEHYDKTGELP